MGGIWAYMRLYDQISWDLANFCVERMAGLLGFLGFWGGLNTAPLKKKSGEYRPRVGSSGGPGGLTHLPGFKE